MIPEQTIQLILDKANIVDVISEYIRLRRSGVNFTGCCPFHNENTPSLVVSPAKSIFKCFGCGKSGNVIHFVMEQESLTFPEAVRLLGARFSVEVPRATKEDEIRSFERETLWEINKEAHQFFVQTLSRHKQALGYLKDRNIDQILVKDFGLGSASALRDALLTHLKKKGYSEKAIQDAGLVTSQEGGSLSDRFRDRLVFPFYDLLGHIVGFTGRILPSQDNRKLAKYLNTPETEVYKKSKILFGLYQGKRMIAQTQRSYLLEGNVDVLRFHQKGIQNTVAPCGTALTEDHVRLLGRFCQRITLIFDGDSAGVAATLKGLKVCLAQGMKTYVAMLPKGEDPDTFALDKTQDQILSWIESSEQDFLVYMCQVATGKIEKSPAEKAELLHELWEMATLIPDQATRELYYDMICEKMAVERERMMGKQSKHKEKKPLTGLSANEKAIKEMNQLIVYPDSEHMMESLTEDLKANSIILNRPFTGEELEKIAQLTQNICFAYDLEAERDSEGTPAMIEYMMGLSLSDINIMVNEGRSADTQFTPFKDFYFDFLASSVNPYSPDSKKRNVEKAAWYLSQLDATTQSLLTASIAKKFSLSKTDFSAILKPYISKAKNTVAQKNEEIVIDDEKYIFSIENLPDYVDQSFFNKYKHFAAQNREGKKVFYVFANEFGTLQKVGNFYMEPQFQVYSEDPQKNKRIVKLNHADLRESKYVEIPSNDMIEFGAFRKFLFRQGPYLLRNAKTFHLDYILDSIALQFPVAHELSVFGQQPEDFYALSNAVVIKGEVVYMNDLGLINHEGRTYYSPSCSVIYADTRRDDDNFMLDRYFTYRPGEVAFKDWAEKVKQVYKYNDNGYWTLLMAIMCAFRSDIFPIDRLFTTLMFIGPTECGKSQLAQTIRALYMNPDAPMFNLNSGTDAAFFTIMERFRDAPTIMEEYNDQQINDVKFQGLKSTVYDGEGKAKRLDPKTTGLDFSKVNAVPILLGQEAPMRDDASLANRCVMCNVPKRDRWEDQEIKDFQILKDWEKSGLTHLLVLILKHRGVIREHFRDHLRGVQKQLRDDLTRQGLSFQTRILNTVTLFLAMCDIIEQRLPDMPLPFTYSQFYPIARQKVISQSDMITNTNRLATFFDTFVQLTEDLRHGLQSGKEYKVETVSELTIREGRENQRTIVFDAPQKVLFMRLEVIHSKYRDRVGQAEHLKMTNLQNYLKDHPCYLGNVKQTTFQWENETRFVDESGIVRSRMSQEQKRTSAIALKYDAEALGFDLGETSHLSAFAPAKDLTDRTQSETRELSVYPDTIQEKLPF